MELIIKVVPCERADGVEPSDGEAGGVATLHHHHDRVVIVVEGFRVRLPRLFVRNNAGELMETISGIFEGGWVACVGGHPRGEVLHRDVDAKIYNVPDEVGGVNLGRVNLDDGPVFIKPAVPNVASNGGRQKDVADDSLLGVLPVPVAGVREECLEVFDTLLRFLQQRDDRIRLSLSVRRLHPTSSIQPHVELLDEVLRSPDLGLDVLEVLLGSGFVEEQDLPEGLASAVALD